MTQERQPARLQRIRLSEISLVDRPANPHAVVTLFKRADDTDPEENEMHFQKAHTPRGYRTLDEAVAAIADAENVCELDAMRKVSSRYPHLVQKFNADGDALAKRAAEERRVRDQAEVAKREAFERSVDEIQMRDRCSRLDAMRTLARERPDVVETYRSS